MFQERTNREKLEGPVHYCFYLLIIPSPHLLNKAFISLLDFFAVPPFFFNALLFFETAVIQKL